MTHWQQKPRARPGKRSASKILALREARRTLAISVALGELSRLDGQDNAVHALVAERTGLPLGFIQWKYPTLESLVRVADLT
jgi:hypothetical protein